MSPFMRYAKAERVCLPGSIAVTFGTFGKLFDRRGLYRDLRLEVVSFTLPPTDLTTKAQSSHYLVVALNICAL